MSCGCTNCGRPTNWRVDNERKQLAVCPYCYRYWATYKRMPIADIVLKDTAPRFKKLPPSYDPEYTDGYSEYEGYRENGVRELEDYS